jgi:hypothetical protein
MAHAEYLTIFTIWSRAHFDRGWCRCKQQGHERSLRKSDPSGQSKIFADPTLELSGYLTNKGMKIHLA